MQHPQQSVELHCDPRALRAMQLAAKALAWGRTEAGAYLVPSVSREGVFHAATIHTCTCEDNARGHACQHRLAVAIFECWRTLAEQALATG